MEEIVVNSAVDRLMSIPLNEVQILLGTRREFEFLRCEFQQLKAYLRDADFADQRGDNELKELLEQLRDLTLDTEDVLEEFNFYFSRNHVGSHGTFLYNAWCFVKNLRARHRIASMIHHIRFRVSNISYRIQIYNNKPSIPRVSSKLHDSREDALLLDRVDLVGIDKPKVILVDWLINGEPTQKVMPVVGMGGLGKTTLVNQAYVDGEVRKHFKIHAWVTMAQSCKVQEVLKDIVRQIFFVIRKPIPQELDVMNILQLKEKINTLLRSRRYLIVLDDVWHVAEWEAVRYAFPSNSLSSRIIITTRNKDVASTSCADFNGKIFNMKPLHDADSWCLFLKKTFQNNSCPDYLYDICQSILKFCEGLPLAIVAVSGVLATKNISRIDEWEKVSRSLGAEIEGNDKLEGMDRVLSLSFDDLPYYLKPCYIYLSIFPEDHLIERMRLIRLWIAEGFIQDRQGITPEEVADGYLEELLNRSLIQMAEKTTERRVKTCRVHDLLREIINRKSQDQNFAVTRTKNEGVLLPENVRRLSVSNTLQNLMQDKPVHIPKLRSLLMFGVEDRLCKSFLSTSFPFGLRLLKVLDLQGAPLDVFPDTIVNLKHLKFLSLRKTKVSKIPRSIKKLQCLETLDLKHSMVTELPYDVLKLQKLRHLLVYRCKFDSYPKFKSKDGFQFLGRGGKRNFKALDYIGCLQSLQKLNFIDVKHGEKVILTQLGRLTQLRRLGIINLWAVNEMVLCSSLKCLKQLRSFSVYTVDQDNTISLHHLSSEAAPKLLQRINLAGRLETLPPWISSLNGLVKVSLKWSQLDIDPLLSLQHLPNLVHLELLQTYSGDQLQFDGKGFQKLKVLCLDKFNQLESVVFENGAMPYLKKLRIMRCKLLHEVPNGIEHLTKLKYLELFDMPDELIKTIIPKEGKDHMKIADIPEVYFTYFRDVGWDIYSLDNIHERIESPDNSTAIRTKELGDLWKV